MTGRLGRTPVYANDDERAKARAASKAKWKNVSLDHDLVEALHAIADDLKASFGFRPTLSQTVRHLINGKKSS